MLLLTQSFAPQWFPLLTQTPRGNERFLLLNEKEKEPMFLFKDCMKRQTFGPCYKGVTEGISRPQRYTGNKEDLGSFLCNRVPPASTNQKLHGPLVGGTVPSLSSSVWFLLWSLFSFSSRNSYKGWLHIWANPQKPDKPVIKRNHTTNNSIKLNHYMLQLKMYLWLQLENLKHSFLAAQMVTSYLKV